MSRTRVLACLVVAALTTAAISLRLSAVPKAQIEHALDPAHALQSRDDGRDGAADELSKLARQVQELREQHEELAARVRSLRTDALASAAADAAPPLSSSSERAPQPRMPDAEEARADTEVLLASLDERLNESPPDEQFDAWAERQLAALGALPGLTGTRLLASECRKSMCRIEMAYLDTTQREHFMSQMRSRELFRGDLLLQPLDETGEAPGALIYVAREGERFGLQKSQ